MTPSEFKLIFPEFSGSPDAAIQNSLNKADLRVSQSVWGDFYEEGIGFYAAHDLAMACMRVQTKGASDDNVSESAGDVSRSRDSKMMQDAAANPLLRTSYGQEFLALSKSLGFGALAV